jgi:hypothetical protein
MAPSSLPALSDMVAQTRKALRVIAVALGLVVAPPFGPAGPADFHVDPEAGDDARDGLATTVESATRGPVRTIQRAVRAAGPGDTVHLAASREPYRESLLLSGPSNWTHPGGEPGRPLVIDGHGGTLTGAEPCPPAGWEPWRGRVYRRADFPQAAALMVGDERVPAASPTLALEPGDWIYFPPYKHLYLRPAAMPVGEVQLVPAEGEPETVAQSRWGPAGAPGVVRLVGVAEPAALMIAGRRVPPITIKERLKPGQCTVESGTVYYHLPEEKSFESLSIECVVRSNGVHISGTTAHVVIRNLHVTRFSNDGFNIHGQAHDILFQNITATHCFDEGYSAHSDAETAVEGGRLLFNASGLTDVGRARTRCRDMLIAFNDGIGYLGMDATHEDLEDAILIDNGLQLGGGGPESRLRASNVLAVSTGLPMGDGPRGGQLSFGGPTSIDRFTAIGPHASRFTGDAAVTLCDMVLLGGKADWHFRTDEPRQRLPQVEGLQVDPAVTMSWGAKPPFASRPLLAWLEEFYPGQARAAEAKGLGTPAGVISLDGLPATGGCPSARVAKAREFLGEHRQRLEAAAK